MSKDGEAFLAGERNKIAQKTEIKGEKWTRRRLTTYFPSPLLTQLTFLINHPIWRSVTSDYYNQSRSSFPLFPVNYLSLQSLSFQHHLTVHPACSRNSLFKLSHITRDYPHLCSPFIRFSAQNFLDVVLLRYAATQKWLKAMFFFSFFTRSRRAFTHQTPERL